MPVKIRESEKYRRVAKSLMRQNVSGEKHVKGIFSTLAKWRQPMPEKDKKQLIKIAALHFDAQIKRQEIDRNWTRILMKMPRPRYVN